MLVVAVPSLPLLTVILSLLSHPGPHPSFLIFPSHLHCLVLVPLSLLSPCCPLVVPLSLSSPGCPPVLVVLVPIPIVIIVLPAPPSLVILVVILLLLFIVLHFVVASIPML